MIQDITNIIMDYTHELNFLQYIPELQSAFRKYIGVLNEDYYFIEHVSLILYKMDIKPNPKYSILIQDFHDTHIR